MSEQETILQADVKKEINPLFNPFPGLRPFGIDESHLFFGREGQSEEVLKHLSKNRFIAVIGASGSGKSSLMYCGVVPILYGGFITSAGSKWNVLTTRPGNDPINNLAHSLVESRHKNNIEKENISIDLNITKTLLRTSSLGLVEAVKLLKTPHDENILILVDQFEELFRFKQSRKGSSFIDESESYVKLLVEAVSQKKVPVYIILTMRSDFIGDCSQFQELTELINLSNYLIPQMTRDNFREAITGPVAVGGGAIEQNLVQELLNDIGDNPDQLPILQHALMRTWEHWINHGQTNIPLSIEDYEAVGKMEKALSEHANEAFDELSPGGKEICSALFKTLTERGADNRGVRRPTRIESIADISLVQPTDVYEVVETFRKTGRSFLAPSPEVLLTPETVVDISHESLMRIWDKLKSWVEEEANSVQMYKRLAEASELYQLGKTTLWRPPDLHLAISWKNTQKPTLEWAQRYNPAFERTIVFLETSDKEFKAEEQNKIKLQKRALRRTRIFAIVLGSAAIVALGLTIFAFMQTKEATRQKALAEVQRVEAEKQKEIADQEKIKAQEQEQLAKEQEQIAKEQEKIAQVEKSKAQEQEQIAQVEKSKAQEQEQIAKEQTIIAQENFEKAEEARKAALKLRMLSISQSMAVKSQQIQDDPELKALLAKQAYLFNIKFEGPKHHADIYKGLYDAIKAKLKPKYNVYSGHTDAIMSVFFDPKKNIVYSMGIDGRINKCNLFDTVNTYQQITQIKFLKSVSFSTNKDYLAFTTSIGPDKNQIQLINLNSDSLKTEFLTGHKGSVVITKFLNNENKLLSIANDSTILLWDIKNKKHQTICKIKGRATSLGISKNNKLFAVGTDNGNTTIFNLSDGKIIREFLYSKENPVYAINFNHSNTIIALGDNTGNIKVYNFTENKSVAEFKGHTNRITDLKFSPDDKLLASSSRDASIKLWDATDYNNQPYLLNDHESIVTSIDFNKNGDYLISGSTDETMILWPVNSDKMANEICNYIKGNLTEEQWNTYVAKDVKHEKTCEK